MLVDKRQPITYIIVLLVVKIVNFVISIYISIYRLNGIYAHGLKIDHIDICQIVFFSGYPLYLRGLQTPQVCQNSRHFWMSIKVVLNFLAVNNSCVSFICGC